MSLLRIIGEAIFIKQHVSRHPDCFASLAMTLWTFYELLIKRPEMSLQAERENLAVEQGVACPIIRCKLVLPPWDDMIFDITNYPSSSFSRNRFPKDC